MSPSKKTSASEEFSYEEAFAALEAIVESLENEQHPLDEAIALYERGQALSKHCAMLLEKAELKVRQLSGDALVGFEAGE